MNESELLFFPSQFISFYPPHTDLWDKEEEGFVDSISFKNSQAYWEEEKRVTVTYVFNSSSLFLPGCVCVSVYDIIPHTESTLCRASLKYTQAVRKEKKS